MSGIRLWNGDICDLEVDAIVAPAPTSLWMTAGVGAAIKQRGGHGIEFEAVARGPQPLGTAVATGAGSLASRYVVHAVTLGSDRKMSAPALDASTRAAVRLADSLGLRTMAFASLGSPLGGVPLAESAEIMVRALREELPRCASIDEIFIAVPGARTYATFHEELGRSPRLAAVPVVPGANARRVPVMDENPDGAPAGTQAGEPATPAAAPATEHRGDRRAPSPSAGSGLEPWRDPARGRA